MRVLLGWFVLLVLSSSPALAQSCRQVKATPINAGACLSVTATAVTVMSANTSRCSASIMNASNNPLRCRDISKDGTPTGLVGVPILGGASLLLGTESQGSWQCIRDSTATGDGVACIAEGLP